MEDKARVGFWIMICLGLGLVWCGQVTTAHAQYVNQGSNGQIYNDLQCLPLAGGTMAGNINLGDYKLYSSTGPAYLGTAGSTGHSLVTGDVLMGGKLEVDDVAYFDNAISVALFAYFNTGFSLGDAAAIYGQVRQGAADDGMKMLAGSDGYGNNAIVISAYANRVKAHGHSTMLTNPTLFVHSGTDPESDNTQYLSLSHDATNAIIASGKGSINLQAANGGVRIARVVSATPAEPVACGATTAGTMTYVDDNDDSAAGALCVCIATPDDSHYDWMRMDDNSTACPFF